MPNPGDGPPRSDAPPEVGEALGLLWAASQEVELLSKRMLSRLGVTGPQRLVLRVIQARPGISAGAVASAARLHASTLTGILERLQRGGFLTRDRDADDARRTRFRLTAEGERVAATRSGTIEAAMDASLAGLDPVERALVVRWLSAFAGAVAAERRRLGEDRGNDTHERPG